jgi:hypothetical protein
MANKDILTLQENVHEFLSDTFSSFDTIHKLVGEMRQTAVVDRDLFRDFVPADQLVGRIAVMSWEYYGKDSLVMFAMYRYDSHSEEWSRIKKVTRYAYGHKWPDTTELRDLLITFVAGGYDGQHFKDGVF